MQKFISPALLAAMGNRLVAGREFTWADFYERHPVAMISENLARELWGDPRLAIGKEITPNQKDPWREVIGVVADERSEGMQQQAPASAYYPLLLYNFDQNPVGLSANRCLYYPKQPSGITELACRGATRRLEPESEPSARRRPHARRDLFEIDGTNVFHSRDAGDRRGDGSADRLGRDFMA